MRKSDKPEGCFILAEILNENGDMAKAVKSRFHPTMVSRWKHGVRLPDLQSAIALAEVTCGRLPPDMWRLPKEAA